MATAVRPTPERTPLIDRVPRRAGVSPSENAITLVVATWLIVGLFVDGYAHDHLLVGARESFFNPWHALFYSGYFASVGWLTVLSRRHRVNTSNRWLPLPHGYEAAGIGVVVFAIGGVGDAIWHTIFGFERSTEALLSPTHLFLFVGLVLIASAPFRTEALRVATTASNLGRYRVGLASLTLATCVVAFFGAFAWGLANDAVLRVRYDAVTELNEVPLMAGLASELVTTLILATAALLVLRLGPPRRPSCTVLFTIVALAFMLVFSEEASGVIAAACGGAVIDLLRPRAARRPPAVTNPLAIGVGITAMWATYHGLLATTGDIAWSAPLAAGSPVLSGLMAAALVMLVQSGAAIQRGFSSSMP